MTIRNILLFTMALCTYAQTFAQVNIGKSKSPLNLYVSDLDEDEIELAQKAPTYFVVPQEFDYDEFVAMAENVWTFNEIKFVLQKDYDEDPSEYKKGGNVVIYARNIPHKIAVENKREMDASNLGMYVTFRIGMTYYKKVEKKKNGELKVDGFTLAEIFFTPSIKFRSDMENNSMNQSLLKPGKIMNKTKNIDKQDFKESYFYNYDLGYIKNYLQALNTKLLNKENFNIRDGFVDKEKIKALKNNTLYAPAWILKEYNPMRSDFRGMVDPEELFNKYDYDYTIINNDELNQMILDQKDFHYLMYTQYNKDKVISVINGKSGEIIYMQEDSAYNIKDSDLKSINKLID